MDTSIYECVYCGLMAQSRDHVIPVSYKHVDRRVASWGKTEVVPACMECNSLLGNRWLPIIAERAAFIAAALTIRHKKLLAFPNWTIEDLEEVSPKFRKQITAKIRSRDLIAARIAFAKAMAGLNLGPLDCWEKK